MGRGVRTNVESRGVAIGLATGAGVAVGAATGVAWRWRGRWRLVEHKWQTEQLEKLLNYHEGGLPSLRSSAQQRRGGLSGPCFHVGHSVDDHLELYKRGPHFERSRSPKHPTFPWNQHSTHFVDVLSIPVHENGMDYLRNNPNAPVLPIVSEVCQYYPELC